MQCRSKAAEWGEGGQGSRGIACRKAGQWMQLLLRALVEVKATALACPPAACTPIQDKGPFIPHVEWGGLVLDSTIYGSLVSITSNKISVKVFSKGDNINIHQVT